MPRRVAQSGHFERKEGGREKERGKEQEREREKERREQKALKR